ncbi:hypothetical protein ALC53_12611 [Atta colombica]|uniref:Uncharacterized protein n=1 Tax=Atta colombica TaxID=520822 RepID=A0A151HYX5_9HYME|nr:hypothetical protein ALC53_12611 [Atta colombica]
MIAKRFMIFSYNPNCGRKSTSSWKTNGVGTLVDLPQPLQFCLPRPEKYHSGLVAIIYKIHLRIDNEQVQYLAKTSSLSRCCFRLLRARYPTQMITNRMGIRQASTMPLKNGICTKFSGLWRISNFIFEFSTFKSIKIDRFHTFPLHILALNYNQKNHSLLTTYVHGRYVRAHKNPSFSMTSTPAPVSSIIITSL